MRSAFIHSATFALTVHKALNVRSQILHRALIVSAALTYRPVYFHLFYLQLKIKKSVCASHNKMREEGVDKVGRKINYRLSFTVHKRLPNSVYTECA